MSIKDKLPWSKAQLSLLHDSIQSSYGRDKTYLKTSKQNIQGASRSFKKKKQHQKKKETCSHLVLRFLYNFREGSTCSLLNGYFVRKRHVILKSIYIYQSLYSDQ